jgi:PKD repeat protein
MNPVHTFEEAGAYYVTLTVYNALSSQFDSFSINYTVNSNYLSRPVVIKNSSGGKGYLSIQDAYADISGLIETIRIKTGAPFIEDLFFDREIEVLIAGGYDDSFENVVNFSRVNGKVTISYGKVIVSNLIIGSLN